MKVFEIAFQLAGKMGSTFHSTFGNAQKKITETDQQIKKLTASQGKVTRFDGLKKELIDTGYKFQAAKIKVKNLEEELASAEKPTKAMERALAKARGEVEKLQNKLTDQHAALSKHQKEMTASGLATVKTAEQTKKLAGEIEALKKQRSTYETLQTSVDTFKTKTISAFKGIAAVTAVATTAIGGYYVTALKLAGVVSEQAGRARTGARYGFGMEAYQELSYAAQKVGIDVDNFDKSMMKFRVNMAKGALGTGPLAEEFKRMGYDVKETMANLGAMKPEQQLMRLTEFMRSLPDDATRSRMAVQLFGKEGMKMMGFIKAGEAGLQGFRQEARELGIVLSDETVKQATEYGRAKKIFGQVWKGTEITIGAAILPGLTAGLQELVGLVKANKTDIQLFAKNFADGLRESIPPVLEIVRGVKNIAVTLIDLAKGAAFAVGGFDNLLYIAGALFAGQMLWAIGAWGTSIFAAGRAAIALYSSLKGVAVATRLWAAAQAAMNAVWAANPVGIVLIALAALAAGIYWVYKNWDKVKNFMVKLWNSPAFAVFAFLTGPIGLLIGAVVGIIANWDKVKAWFTLLWNNPKAAFIQFIDLIMGKFGQLVGWLGDKVGQIKNLFTSMGSGGPAVGGGEGGDTRVRPHAAGGFFSQPHLGLVAEKKPEWIIPTDGSARSMSLLAGANKMMGFGSGQPQGFAAINLQASRSDQAPIQLSLANYITISGDKDVQSEVEAGINRGTNNLLQQLEALRAERERVSFA